MLAPAPAARGAWGPGLAQFELAPDARLAGHSGGAWGWGADLWFDPDRGNGYAAIGNSTSAGEVLQPLFAAWKRWYSGSIPREVPDIPVDDAVRPFLGEWEGHIDTGERELRSRWTLTEDDGLLRGTYTYSSGTESPLDVLLLDEGRFNAKIRRTPASYFHALEVSPDLVRGHYYEDKRHTFVLRRKRR